MKETEVAIYQDTDYGWVQDFLTRHSISLPAGRALLLGAQNRDEPVNIFNKGVTALLVSVGSGDAYHDSIGISVDRRFSLVGRWWVQGPTNNKPWNQFTDSDVDMCVDVYVSSRNIKYVTSDLDEEYHGGTLVNYADNPPKWVRLQKRIGSKLAEKGQRWYDNYAGSVPEPQRLSIAKARSVLSSKANMLAWLKDGGEEGGRAIQAPFWAESLYNEPGCHTILNCYYRGADDDRTRVWYLLFVLAVGRGAMDETGSGKSLMAYTEGVNSEFTQYSHYWRRDLDGGGNVVCANFPSPFYGYMLFQYFAVYLYDVENGCWKEPALFGTNPNICMPEQNEPGFYYHVDGASPTRQQPANWGNYNEHDVPYPNRPLGYENSPFDAAVWFRRAYDHVGNANRYYPSISVSGGNSATPGSQDSMLADCYERKLPYAYYGTDGAGKRWLCAFYVRDDDGPQWIDATFVLAGITVSMSLCSGIPRLRLFDQTA